MRTIVTMSKTTRLVAISDTHAMHGQIRIPDGDLLLHAGDFTGHGTLEEVEELNRFLATCPQRHKVLIAGNHDLCFERDPRRARPLLHSCIYLEDSGVELEGLKIWGSPWQPWFFDWAFNLERGSLHEKWDMIPNDVDVLITHGPPMGYRDLTNRGMQAGCEELLAALERVQPALHICGHIHEGYGVTRIGRTTCVNASVCTAGYAPTNPPVVLELTRGLAGPNEWSVQRIFDL